MKPAIELVKEWRTVSVNEECGLAPSYVVGLRKAADDLQAWSREADKECAEAIEHCDGKDYETVVRISWIRRELLGTTRTEGKK